MMNSAHPVVHLRRKKNNNYSIKTWWLLWLLISLAGHCWLVINQVFFLFIKSHYCPRFWFNSISQNLPVIGRFVLWSLPRLWTSGVIVIHINHGVWGGWLLLWLVIRSGHSCWRFVNITIGLLSSTVSSTVIVARFSWHFV